MCGKALNWSRHTLVPGGMAAPKLNGLRAGRLQRLLLRELREHRFVQANAALHVLEREILVRRMSAAISQGQAHQKRLYPKNTAKLRDNGDAPAFSDHGRVFA